MGSLLYIREGAKKFRITIILVKMCPNIEKTPPSLIVYANY